MDNTITAGPAPARLTAVERWLAILMACAVDFALCMGLIDSNYFNDDLEQLADGAFWKSVYVTQLDVHMPLGAMISAAWSHLVGSSWDHNRVLAAAYHLPVCAIIVLWMAKLFPGRRGLLIGIAASVGWSLSHIYSWGYLNLTEVPTTMFLLLGLYWGLDLKEGAVSIKRPILLGAMFGFAGLSRIMNGLQILFLMAAMLAVAKMDAKQRLSALLKICIGGILPVIAMSLYLIVDGRLRDAFYFALAHNFESKAGAFHAGGWFGNLAAPEIRASYALAGLALVLGLCAAFSPAAGFALIIAAGAIGGWLSDNPTGIADYPFHAIPAFPFFAILAGIGVGAMFTAKRAADRRSTPLAVLIFNLALLVGLGWWGLDAARAYGVWLQAGNAIEDKARALRVGGYIQKHTPPGSKIFVFGTDPQIYVTSKRDSASMASFLYNEMTQYKGKILDQVKASQPSAIYMPKDDYWHSRDMSDFPELVAYFMANYTVNDNPEILLRLQDQGQGHVAPLLTDDERKIVNPYMAAQYKCSIGTTDTSLLEAKSDGLTVDYVKPGVWSEKVITFAKPVEFDPQDDVELTIELMAELPPGASLKPVRLLVADRDGKKFWTWIPLDEIRAHAGQIRLPLSRLGDDAGGKPTAALTDVEVGGWQDYQGVAIHLGAFKISKTQGWVTGRCDVH